MKDEMDEWEGGRGGRGREAPGFRLLQRESRPRRCERAGIHPFGTLGAWEQSECDDSGRAAWAPSCSQSGAAPHVWAGDLALDSGRGSNSTGRRDAAFPRQSEADAACGASPVWRQHPAVNRRGPSKPPLKPAEPPVDASGAK